MSTVKYLAVFAVFAAIVLTIQTCKPAQADHLEDGVFVNKATGATLKIRNWVIDYQGNRQHFDVWVGKGKRFLSTKQIVGNLFVIEAARGERVPAELTLTNEPLTRTVCSIENGFSPVCFERVP